MRECRLFLGRAAVAALLAMVPGLAWASPEPEPPKLRLPSVAEPAGYAADLTIDPGKASFHGSIDIDIRIKARTDLLWLNATDLKIEKASMTGAGNPVAIRVVPGGEDFVGFAFDRPIDPGAFRLHVDYTGTLGETTTQGLFRQKEGEDWYAFSQLESTDARRAFPCFDEPGYKVPWQLTLRIPKATTAVSNTPIESDAAAADGSRVVRFKKTAPLPAYLVALGVGPFDYLDAGTAGSKKIPIRIITPRGKSAQGRYAAQTTGPLLDRLEAYFGIPYPYEKLDQLAIPQTVSFAAMENAGLITWTERVLIAPPSEDSASWERSQASINAHEMAHQWFGDLVTLAWWDDVWLNESFATWMADRTLIAWKPEWHTDVARVQDSSNVMFEDILVNTRKIRQEIDSMDDIANAFDGISYQKGAAVLTMFEAWVGPEKFQKGVHNYLEAHRFGNATVRDFLAAIEAATQPGVAAAFSTFLDQPGVPVIDVALDCAGGTAKLALSQKRLLPIGSTGSTAQVWKVPVCTREGTSGKDARACSLLWQPEGSTPSPTGGCAAWVMANDGEVGYYRALYEGDLLQKLLAVADTKLSLAERVGLIRDVNALAEAGALPMGEALALVPRFAGDSSRQIVQATLRISGDIRQHLVPPDLKPNYARFLSKTYGARARALGWARRPGDDDDTDILREALVPYVARYGEEPQLQAQARQLAQKWLEDPSSLQSDMTAHILDVAAYSGDRQLFDRFLAAAKKEKERRNRRRLLGALGSFRDPALVQEAMALFLANDFDSRETRLILFSELEEDPSRPLAWEFMKAHYDEIVAKLPHEETGEMPFFADGFCDATQHKDVASFFQSRADKLPGGPRNLAQALETIDLCMASKTAQEPSVREFLTKY